LILETGSINKTNGYALLNKCISDISHGVFRQT
jgi:hypothetical protein